MNDPTRKILVVDDDLRILRDIRKYLAKQGYEVLVAADGRTALETLKSNSVDLVILDLNFPNAHTKQSRAIDGIDVLRELQGARKVAVLMLSSTNISAVKVMALTIGADDYVSKPFEMPELGARIEAILRRTTAPPSKERVLSYRRLRVDPGARRVWKDGKPVEFTGVEFDILYTLARRPEHVFTREKLLELAWKDPCYSISKVIDVHIGHIRKKLEDNPARPTLIVTVRGVGYRFEDSAPPETAS